MKGIVILNLGPSVGEIADSLKKAPYFDPQSVKIENGTVHANFKSDTDSQMREMSINGIRSATKERPGVQVKPLE